MNRQLIIFDLDGTLVDSLHDLTEAVNHARDTFSLAPLVRDEVQTMVGQGARTLMERALPGRSGDEIDRGLAIFLAYNELHLADHTRPYPGIPELLAELERIGMQMTVVSNKHAALCRHLLELLGLVSHFTGIYGADSFAERKPSPLPFIEVMRLAQALPSTTVVVGDSSNDVIAAQAAGIPVIGCSYGYGPVADLASATALAATSHDLLPLLYAQAGRQCD